MAHAESGHGRQASSEMYVPRSMQVWRGLVNWLAFFFQIFLQILRGTPSLAQFLSYIGLRQSFLSAAAAAPSPSPPPPSPASCSPPFKPLPVVEIPLQDSCPPEHAGSDSDVSVAGDDDLVAVERLTIVLDLDETLVCAYETSSLPEIIRAQAIEAGLKWFELECVSSDKECDGKPKVNYVTVFERPGLHEFLKRISEFANLILFTAGLEDYARPLVDRIDKDNVIGERLYRPSTVSTEYREHVKDLSCLSKNLSRIVIVDNNPFSFLLQPLNGIPCVPFSAGQPYDDQLLVVLLPLLKHLSLQRDVRPVLYERFHMPEWFQMHGIPTSGNGV
ncbi:uncharacterized protein LOC115663063 [Syzygium oleosum]|uniref:uncharacterized protein LOC115663063 n=1 Tax=Syzygium oleosum TaxID=219896 RepID=UPI0024B9A477|nr:uncharacterized protein LOC115663063 [Syzygium oleosum]